MVALKSDIVLKVQYSFLSQVFEKYFAKWRKKGNTYWAERLECVNNSSSSNNGHKHNRKHTVLTKNCFKLFIYLFNLCS